MSSSPTIAPMVASTAIPMYGATTSTTAPSTLPPAATTPCPNAVTALAVTPTTAAPEPEPASSSAIITSVSSSSSVTGTTTAIPMLPADDHALSYNYHYDYYDTDNTTSPATTPSDTSRHSITTLWHRGYTPHHTLSTISDQSLRTFYERQNNLLHNMAKAHYDGRNPFLSNSSDEGDFNLPSSSSDDDCQTRVQRAIILSNVCNCILLLAQLYAFVCSRSLSMLAVFVDAMLDMISGVVVGLTWYMKRLKDRIRYPVGRQRLEPLGVIGMACLMTAATLVTLEQALGSLLEPLSSSAATAITTDQPVTHHVVVTWDTCAVLLTALTIKAGLYTYCHAIPHDSVQALAEDHFNDCLSNVVTLATIFLARFLAWWIDPVGAIIISILIIRNWALLTLRHCDQLLGKVASTDILNLVTFVACNHSGFITKVDTVTAYHVGSGIYSEVHVVLDKDMPLSMAHDIGEALQNRIERLPQIERCFVHLDVESAHSPSVEHKDI